GVASGPGLAALESLTGVAVAARAASERALSGRALIELQLDQHTADPGAPQRFQRFLRQVRGQFDQAVVGPDADMTEVAAPQPALVGDSADDRARRHPMTIADADPVSGQLRAGGPMAGRATGTFLVEAARRALAVRALDRLRFGLHEEVVAVVRADGQRGRDIDQGDVVLALVLLDQLAE